MTVTTTPQTPTVEVYATKYPDVPVEVILKEDLLRRGIGLTDAAMEAARGYRTQAYYLFFEGYGPMGGGPGVAVYGNTASVDFGG